MKLFCITSQGLRRNMLKYQHSVVMKYFVCLTVLIHVLLWVRCCCSRHMKQKDHCDCLENTKLNSNLDVYEKYFRAQCEFWGECAIRDDHLHKNIYT